MNRRGRGHAALAEMPALFLPMMVVATYIEEFEGKVSSASVKQPMAALRMLFDWLVVGPVLQSGELGAGTDALPPGQ